MAHVVADRVMQQTTTTGTGAFAVSDMPSSVGYQSFYSVTAEGDTFNYCAVAINDTTGAPTGDWEIGVGKRVGLSPTTLVRQRVLTSSNEDGLVNFPAGTKNVFLGLSASFGTTRERLTSARTYYVKTTGSDSNTGLGPAAAFLTLQRAVDAAYSLDCNGQSVTISIDNGTYDGGASLNGPLFGGGYLTINVFSGATVVLTKTNAHCIQVFGGAAVTLTGMRVQTTSWGCGIYAENMSKVGFYSMTFGACASGHIQATRRAIVQAIAGFTIAGNAPYFASGDIGSSFEIGGYVVTLTGAPVFSTAFLVLAGLSYARCTGMSVSGSSTGPKYNISQGSIGYAGAAVLPGSTAGAVATGGQYF